MSAACVRMGKVGNFLDVSYTLKPSVPLQTLDSADGSQKV